MSENTYDKLLTKIDQAFDEWQASFEDSEGETNEESPSTHVTEASGYDPVTEPVQYHIGGIETIDIMRIVLTREEFKGYLKGNIIKYRERAMHKGKPEEDWAKAREYKRIYTIEFGHTDMSELKDEFDNGVGLGYWKGVASGFEGFELGTQGDLRPKKEYR